MNLEKQSPLERRELAAEMFGARQWWSFLHTPVQRRQMVARGVFEERVGVWVLNARKNIRNVDLAVYKQPEQLFHVSDLLNCHLIRAPTREICRYAMMVAIRVRKCARRIVCV
jgi:hypothetical protein